MSLLHARGWLPITLALLLGALLAAPPPTAAPPTWAPARPVGVEVVASSSWLPSVGLLVSEVVTGGASASDEFVELYNAASVALNLDGLELAYVTATGSTVTRKQAWSELWLAPGTRLLLANSAGAHAGLADGLYSGGLAASGGSLVLRVIGGPVIDSLSWGSAASEFAEGAPGPAPAAGWSLERKPGGALGNGVDTNDNLADTLIEPNPVPEGLTAPPAPSPTPSAMPPPTADPTPTSVPSWEPEPNWPPEPEPTWPPVPEPEPTLEPEPEPTLEPEPEPAPSPIVAPTASPSQAPEPTPSPEPTSEPTPPPSATLVQPIATVRSLPIGTPAAVEGWLTTPTGLTETGRGAFVQDASAGVALYLATADWPKLPVGTLVRAHGTLDSRFSQLTLRLASAGDLVALDEGQSPAALELATGEAGEAVEGLLVSVEGWISDGISALTDGFSTAIDDGSGSVRVVVAAATGIAPEQLARGAAVRLTGVVGQRDSSGTGSAGYRVHLRSVDDVEPGQPPTTPIPSPAPSISPAPTSSPPPTSSPTPTPSPSAAPTTAPDPAALPIAAARALVVGSRAVVSGVVTAPTGRILGEQIIAIQDASGGICVKLPAGSYPDVVPGRLIVVDGVLAAPYGNLELRAIEGGVAVVDTTSQPQPRRLSLAGLNETTEGLLALVSGTIRRIDSASSGSLTLILEDTSGEGRVFFFGALGMSRSDFAVGQQIEVTGIVGDRLGLYRLWPRSQSDIAHVPTGGGSTPPVAGSPPAATNPPATGGEPPNGTAGPTVIAIAQALGRHGQQVAVEGIVNVQAGLLDADPRRIAVEDASAGIMVRLPADFAAPPIGQRLRLIGQVSTYYGAPQLTVNAPPVALERASLPIVRVSAAPLSPSLEWRVVTVAGPVETVRRSGDAWRAELAVGSGGIPIAGVARSGIPSTALSAGSNATVTGIVRRAYPTATDQRLAIVPRGPADISLGSGRRAAGGPDGVIAGAPLGPGQPGSPLAFEADDRAAQVPAARPANVALSALAGRQGTTVLVGGLIDSIAGLRVTLSDESGTAVVRLSGAAAELAGRLAPGMLLNAEGVVERTAAGGLEVNVDDPDRIAFTDSPRARPSDSPASAALPQPPSDATSAADDAGRSQPALAIVGLLIMLAGAGAALAVGRRWGWPDAIRAAIARRLPALARRLPI